MTIRAPILVICAAAAAFAQTEPGDLVFDRVFGTRGPNGTAYTLHAVGSAIYFGGYFSSYTERVDRDSDGFLEPTNGLVVWQPGSADWFDASAGLPTDVDFAVLSIEEHNGELYCAFAEYNGSVSVAKLGTNGIWSELPDPVTLAHDFDASGVRLQSFGGALYLSRAPDFNCDLSLTRFTGGGWETPFAAVGTPITDLFVYSGGGTPVLLHGNAGSGYCYDGTIGALVNDDWAGWSACPPKVPMELPVSDIRFTEFQGVVYASGAASSVDPCSDASVYVSNSTLSGWAEIPSGPATIGYNSTTAFAGTLQAGACEWLVLLGVSTDYAPSTNQGWSFDGQDWEIIGTGVSALDWRVYEGIQVGGWLYVVGQVGGGCGYGSGSVARLRSIADWNGNGIVSGQDVSLFSSALANQSPIADLNCDGAWNGADTTIFNARYQACQP